MPTWPSIVAPSFGFDDEMVIPQIETPMDGNYVQTRRAATRDTGIWPLHWKAMSNADYETLRTFVKTYKGGSFDWTHPTRATAHVCTFVGDSFKGKVIEKDASGFVWEVDCPIREI